MSLENAIKATKITDGTDTALVTAAGEVNVLDSNSAAIKTAVEIIDNAVSGAGFNITQQGGVAVSLNTGVRDAGTQRVTIATNDSLPVTFTGSTDVATQTTLASLLTSSQLLDDTVATLGTTTYTEATTKANVIGAVRRDADTALVDTTNEIAPLQVNAGGQLKTAVIVSALPTGAATSALQTQPGVDIGDVTINNAAGASAVNIQDGGNSLTVDAPVTTPVFVRLSDGAAAIATLPVSAASLPLPTGAATETTLGTRLTETDFDTKTGSLTEAAPASDTASSGLNGRLQRIAQRVTSLITALGSPFQAGGSIGNLFALDTTLVTTNTEIGIVTEAAPASDTASSGLNGRLQRVAQRLTSLIALLPTSLGQGTMATSLKVVLPSDQSAIPVTLTSTTITGTVTVDTELNAAAALADAASATVSTASIGAVPLLMNASTVDRQRAVINTLDSTGTGIAAAGIVAQFDDVSPTASTENQFSPVRMSQNRNLYGTIRDAGGNERGANVTDKNDLQVYDYTNRRLLEDILVKLDELTPGGSALNAPPNRILRDNFGRDVMAVANTRDRIKTATLTLSASTAETTLISGIQDSYIDLLAVVVSNTSAATNTRVDIRDATGGTIIIPLQSIGGGSPVGFSLGGVAIPQGAKGQSWTAQCATSTTDIRVLAIYSVN